MKKKALNITGLLFKEIPWKREKERERESIDHLKRPKSKRQQEKQHLSVIAKSKLSKTPHIYMMINPLKK